VGYTSAIFLGLDDGVAGAKKPLPLAFTMREPSPPRRGWAPLEGVPRSPTPVGRSGCWPSPACFKTMRAIAPSFFVDDRLHLGCDPISGSLLIRRSTDHEGAKPRVPRPRLRMGWSAPPTTVRMGWSGPPDHGAKLAGPSTRALRSGAISAPLSARLVVGASTTCSIGLPGKGWAHRTRSSLGTLEVGQPLGKDDRGWAQGRVPLPIGAR